MAAILIGCALLAGMYVLLDRGQRIEEEEGPGPEISAGEQGTEVGPGHVYWDKRSKVFKYQPCGDPVRQYRVQAEDVDTSTEWTELADTLRQMPQIPRFVILEGIQEAPDDNGDGVFRLFSIVRTDPRGNCKEDRIVLNAPLPGEVVSSPLRIQGRARGGWYFEGDFPVLLTDWDGRIVARGIASAEREWMTEEFVPFSCRLEFNAPAFGQGETPAFAQRGTLILRKDNPSDNPALDDALEVPVRFATQ